MSISKSKSLCCVGVIVLVGCWALPADRLLAQAPAAAPEQEAVLDEPTKSQLIDTLSKVFVLLEKKDYVAASQHFVLPPDFQPNMEYQMLDTQDDSVIVALELPGNPEVPKRHQLVRLFRGPLDVHRLAYTIKVDQPTKQTQAAWLAIMKAAKLEAVTE